MTPQRVAACIHEIRGQRVMLDRDLALLYGVTTAALNQAVRRNAERFPEDFVFLITAQELTNLKSQSVISSSWGGRRKAVLAFTEHGVAMLSSVLRSQRASRINVAIMRAFVALRRAMLGHQELARRVAQLEERFDQHDEQIATVFEAIRQMLQAPKDAARKRIGFDRPE